MLNRGLRLFFRDGVDLFVGYPGGRLARLARLEQIGLREMGKNGGNTQMGNLALRWPEECACHNNYHISSDSGLLRGGERGDNMHTQTQPNDVWA